MIFQRVNRSDPERVFIVMQANAANIAKDDAVGLDMTAASVDGVKITQPATGTLHACVGVADNAIANGDYGLVQVWGYRSTSRVFQTNTSIDTGNVLIPVAAADYFASVALTTSIIQPIRAVLLESIASSSASATISAKVFLKAI